MRAITSFFLMGMISMVSCQQRTPSLKQFPINVNAWHVELITNTENKVESILFATYEGKIAAFDPQLESNLWEYDAGAFIFSLKVKDLDLDGTPEILAVDASGQLLALDAAGNLLWSFHDRTPIYAVDAGDLDPGRPGLEIAAGGISRKVFVFDKEGKLLSTREGIDRLVFRMGILDTDRDGRDELFIVENRVIGHMMTLENGKLKTQWRKSLKVPEAYVNWENPRGNFYPFSLKVADVDLNGFPELLMGDTYFNKQAVSLFNAEGEAQWISDRLPMFENRPDTQIEFYATAFVSSSDVFEDIPGEEVISIAGGFFRIFSNTGELLGEQGCRIGFTDLALHGRDLYLSSAPNGDNRLYRVRLDNDWQETVRNIHRAGHYAMVTNNLAELREQVLKSPVNPDIADPVDYEIAIGWAGLHEDNLNQLHAQSEWFRRRFPYDNLKNVYRLKVIEPTPPLDENGQPWSEWRWSVDAINGTMTVEEILEKARWIEENRIPTIFYIGHSCMPFITLETAEKILQAAPEYTVGFISSEDEQIERIPRYFKHYFGPLADLCVKYGYKVAITKNKGLWWLSSPAHREVFDGLFSGERRKVVMAATEDSNSRTPEINLLARGGLWQAGLLQHNEVSIHADLFSFNRFFQWEYPKSGSPYLRLMVAHTTLGMTQLNTRIRDVYETDSGFVFNPIGQESSEIFFHLLGKGLVRSASPENILGYNPIGIVFHQPTEKWLRDAHNGHAPENWEDDPELHRAVIPHNGCLWGMTPTPEHALQAVLLDKALQFGYQVPATPYGLIAFVPSGADLSQVHGIREWWHTDGIDVWQEEGPRLSGEQAAGALESAFAEAAEGMPFRVEGYAFLNIHKIREGHFRLYLVDPGWLDPDDRDVVVRIQADGDFLAEDKIEDKALSISDRTIALTIPAGTLRIIDVIRQ